jgi:hypothetical protein
MPLTGNVIDVQKIQLTDTFQTWFAKTNEIVDALNPVNIYDIDNGAGTNVTYGVTGTAYNGVKYVNVSTGYGVAVGGGSAKPWTGVVGLDISSISGNAYTLTGNESLTAGSIYASEVGDNDLLIVLDTSDLTQGLSGTTKVVRAKHMMPRTVFTPQTTFEGNIVVKGDLTVQGAGSSIAANVLSVTDKFIFLATTGGAGSTAPASTAPILLNAGVVIGISGGTNKEIIWNYNSTNDYITFNTNYGAKSASNALVNSKFIARDFVTSGTTSNTFIFEAAGGSATRMWFTENGVSPYFGIVKDTNSSNVNLNVYNGAGITSVAFIRAGATSQYTGVTANAFIQFANVDMVDGAHAATGASAWTIPVTDQFGEIFAERHNAGQIKRRFTQASHGLTTGQAVAIVITGAAVGVPGTITGAQANSTSTEAFGIVDRVISTSEFSVTMKGYMDLSPNGLLGIGRPVTGQVYYLDWAVKGGLTTNTNVPQGYLYQPLFIPLGGSAGIVYGNEADVIFPFAQDQVYMRGMIPIGAIQPYAGGLAGLSLGLSGGSIPVSDVQYNDNWMPCDGRALSATGTSGFVDLFNLINYTYSMRGVVQSANGALNTVIRPDRGTANLGSLGLGSLAGVVRVIKRGVAGSDSPNIVKTYSYTGLTADGTTITLNGLNTDNVTIASNIVVDILSPKDGIYFFAPDLRGKAPFGEYAPYGARGEGFSLTAGATGGTATGDGGLFTNYLIRAKRDSDAMILTGHNHDSRYLRKDTTDTVSPAGTTLNLQNVEIAGILGNNDNIGIGMSPLSKSQGFTGFALSLNRSGNFGTWVSTYNGGDGGNASAGYRANNAVGDGNLYLSNKTDCTFYLTTSEGCSGGIHLYTRGVTGPIRFSTNATERMRIGPTGNVGIGTSNPNSLLNVRGNNPVLNIENIGSNVSDGGTLRFGHELGGRSPVAEIKTLLTNSIFGSVSGHLAISTSTSGTLSERMRIEAAGNIGMGTTTPTYRLHLVAGATNGPAGVATATDGSVLQVFAYPNQGGSVAYSGTLSNHAHALITNNVQRLWITSAGNVGIGTNTPGNILAVQGGTGDAPTNLNKTKGIVLEGGMGSSSYSSIGYASGGGGGAGIHFSRGGGYQTNISFTTNSVADPGALTERMRIDSGGNVGIGTNSPTNILEVVSTTPGYTGGIYGSNTSSGSYFRLVPLGTNTGVAGWANSSVLFEGVPNSTSSGNTIIGSFYNSLVFQTGARTQRMKIDSSGVISTGTLANSAYTPTAYYNHIPTDHSRTSMVGQYDPSDTQQVWSMGNAYNLPQTPGYTSGQYGSFYGIGWSYNPDYTGGGKFSTSANNNPQSKAGLGHQMLLMWNGVTQTAIGLGIWTAGSVTPGTCPNGSAAKSYILTTAPTTTSMPVSGSVAYIV